MARFSASSLQRVAACPASAVLPQMHRDGAAADRGTAIHAFQAARAEGKADDEALKLVPAEYHQACKTLEHPGTGVAEPAFALDVRSGKARLIGLNIGRDYGKTALTEIPGSADLVRVESDHVVVDDYKTGRTEVPPPDRNLQLGFLARCATKVYGRSRAVVRIVTVFEDGGTYTQAAELDQFDLLRIERTVREAFDAVDKAARDIKEDKQPALREGSHCKYCPARAGCPAKVGLIQRLTQPEVIKEEFRAALNGNTAATAYEMVERASDVLNDLRGQLYQWAQENPIALPDGKVFGPVEQTREEISGEVAHRVLKELHGDAVALSAVELSATKASIERALRGIAGQGQLAGIKRVALAAIAKANGITTTTKTAIKEHTPKSTPKSLTIHKEQ